MLARRYIKLTLAMVIAVLIIGITTPVCAKLSLTQEEKDYIAGGTVIKAVSLDGVAPLQYTNDSGEAEGISRRVLAEISDMTGLLFDYKLYDSLEEAYATDPDINIAIPYHYAPEGMVLSKPFLKSETILFMHSSLDSNQLEDKRYAALRGRTVPEEVKEENKVYFDTREESLDAVEKGKADYGHGNAYSVAFYTLQNGYKNIVSIPVAQEPREYCVGVMKGNDILLSIINKSIESIDSRHIQTLVLDAATHIDQRLTPSMVMEAYGDKILVIAIFIMAILLSSVVYNISIRKTLDMQNKRYELLARISNECLFEFYIKSKQLRLSETCYMLFGVGSGLDKTEELLKDILANIRLDASPSLIKLPLMDDETGVFKIIHSSIRDDSGRPYSIVGKLIDVSEEAAEKMRLTSLSQSDGLTGLYNATTTRGLITRRINNKDDQLTDALILIDSDQLKSVNDTYGHLAGDEVIKSIGSAMKLTFRNTDIMGRIGGDEFCIYIENISDAAFIKTKCRQLNTAIGKLNKEFYSSVSIGIAFHKGEKTYEELFMEADTALYQAKQQGGAQVVLFAPD